MKQTDLYLRRAREQVRKQPALTHAEHSRLARMSTECTAAYMTFGGRCINCGWVQR